jgi:lysophospholipase L1-like esterase
MVAASVLFLVSWIGTWASSPAWADQGMAFQAQTLREVVHVSVGGSRLRVRFTNRFGDAPVLVSGATVGLEAGNTAAAAAGTLHALTFGGARSVTIPPHADVYSDAAALRVPPKSNLLVSFYLPGPTGPATDHPAAYQTNYYAAGNRAAQTSAAGFDNAYESWYFIDGVDVSGTPARGSVVAFGDSITDGAGGKLGADDRWPDMLAARLLALTPREQLGVLNAGIGGNRILLSYLYFGIDALARIDGDVLSQSGARTVIVLLGINDIQQLPHQNDPQRIELGLRQIAGQAHARGMRVMGCTITPYEGWMNYNAAGERARLAVNAWIRHSGVFDGVTDFDAAVRDPNDPHRLLPAYDSGDHLHPNAAGHRAMAAAIDLSKL